MSFLIIPIIFYYLLLYLITQCLYFIIYSHLLTPLANLLFHHFISGSALKVK